MSQRPLAFADAKTETEVWKGVLVEFSRRGFIVWRSNSGALFETSPAGLVANRPVFFRGRLVTFGSPGSPDVIGFCRVCGLFVGIETKRPRGGKVEDSQRVWHAHAQKSRALIALDVRTVAEAVRLADLHRQTCRWDGRTSL